MITLIQLAAAGISLLAFIFGGCIWCAPDVTPIGYVVMTYCFIVAVLCVVIIKLVGGLR